MRKTEKNHGRENRADESDTSENEIPDLNSVKPFEFEPKTNINILPLVEVMMRKKVLKIK